MRLRFLILFALMPLALRAQNLYTTDIAPLDGEYWWGALVNKGYAQPYTDFGASDNYYLDDMERPAPSDKPFDLASMSVKSVSAPVLLSSKGRYVWGSHPFASASRTARFISNRDSRRSRRLRPEAP